jgi:hypothetical protein
MLIPHYSSFGKMNGDPLFIKAEVVPLIPWFTLPAIRKALQEIDKETNVKWFQFEGRWWLHSLKWPEHQDLRADRRGRDLLPSYPGELPEKSGSSPGVVRHEVEVEEEVEVKGKEKKKLKLKSADGLSGLSEGPEAAAPKGKGNSEEHGVGKETPAVVAGILEQVPAERRGAVENLLEMVRSGETSRVSARRSLKEVANLPDLLVDRLLAPAGGAT